MDKLNLTPSSSHDPSAIADGSRNDASVPAVRMRPDGRAQFTHCVDSSRTDCVGLDELFSVNDSSVTYAMHLEACEAAAFDKANPRALRCLRELARFMPEEYGPRQPGPF